VLGPGPRVSGIPDTGEVRDFSPWDCRGLGGAGATVYCTGRSALGRRSDYNRPETVQETAQLVTAAGGPDQTRVKS
jgi:hypothetical protein